MKKNIPYNNSDLPEEFDNFLKKADVAYSKSKKEVWEELAGRMANTETKTGKAIRFRTLSYIAAALIALLLVSGITARFYTKTVSSSTGEHASCLLPDGSEVMLNAETTLTYHPLWWKMKREIKLNGEAFFEVKKGEQFSVISEKGITSVLGTSFNIYARGSEYEVTCVTGKVRVETPDKTEYKHILPNEIAILNATGSITVKTGFNIRESTSWKANEYFFSGSLAKVVEEIERQYNVVLKIASDVDMSELIQANSPNERNVEHVLQNVCRVSHLTFVKSGEKQYTLKKKKD